MKYQHFFSWSIFLLLLRYSENAKILSVFALPAPSHFAMFSSIFEELARRGHEIDIITPLAPGRNVARINYIQIPNVLTEGFGVTGLTIEEQRKFTVQDIMYFLFGQYDNLCRTLFDLEELKLLRDSKKQYDLLILEVFMTNCLFGYAHVFKVPVVALTSSVDLPWGTYRIGNPDNPAYISTYFRGFSAEMTLYERVMNTITLIYTKVRYNRYERLQAQETAKFFGQDSPSLDDLVSNTSLFMLNSHFSLNQARCNVPNVIEVGGLHIGQPKPLRKDLQDFIGESKFIYFSLGTLSNAASFSDEKLKYILDIFKELGYKVLWKANRETLPKKMNISKNIYFDEWMPQLDILSHPNILFFVTHNGMLGTQEAVFFGVPMLSIPLFADQFLNAKYMEQKNVAIIIQIETASKKVLETAMKELIENPKYKENAKKLSDQFKDRPIKPLDEAVYWIEYVLKHKGAPQLRSRSADLAWYQYHLLDVIFVILSSVIVFICIIYKTIKYVRKYVNIIRFSKKLKST